MAKWPNQSFTDIGFLGFVQLTAPGEGSSLGCDTQRCRQLWGVQERGNGLSAEVQQALKNRHRARPALRGLWCGHSLYRTESARHNLFGIDYIDGGLGSSGPGGFVEMLRKVWDAHLSAFLDFFTTQYLHGCCLNPQRLGLRNRPEPICHMVFL